MIDTLSPADFERVVRAVIGATERYAHLTEMGLDPEDFTVEEQKALVALEEMLPGLSCVDSLFNSSSCTLVMRSTKLECTVHCTRLGVQTRLNGRYCEFVDDKWLIR